MKVNTLTQTFLGIGGAIAMGYAGVNWLSDQGKEYHDTAMEPVMQSLTNVEQSAVVQRIRGLVEVRCDLIATGAWQPDLQVILDTQVARYETLTGREWNVADC